MDACDILIRMKVVRIGIRFRKAGSLGQLLHEWHIPVREESELKKDLDALD